MRCDGFLRKGSGIYVLAPSNESVAREDEDEEDVLSAGPFEMLQARQLIESQIAAMAATLITKSDIQKLMEVSKQARNEDRYQDSEWDKRFHLQIAESTQNAVLVYLVERLWHQRDKNLLWQKLHDRIDNRQSLDSWCDDHDVILKALMRRDADAAYQAMWQHLENTKEMLFKASTLEEEDQIDYYLFADKLTLKG